MRAKKTKALKAARKTNEASTPGAVITEFKPHRPPPKGEDRYKKLLEIRGWGKKP